MSLYHLLCLTVHMSACLSVWLCGLNVTLNSENRSARLIKHLKYSKERCELGQVVKPRLQTTCCAAVWSQRILLIPHITLDMRCASEARLLSIHADSDLFQAVTILRTSCLVSSSAPKLLKAAGWTYFTRQTTLSHCSSICSQWDWESEQR